MNDDREPSIPEATVPPPFWKRLVSYLFWIALAGLAGQAILIAFASHWWFADLFSHFRVQGLLLGLLVLTGGVLLRHFYPAIVAGIICGIHAWSLVPYLPTKVEPTDLERARTLLAWNVYVGNSQHQEIVAAIREMNADVVLLMEVGWELGTLLETLRDVYPNMEVLPSPDAFGIAVLSSDPAAEIDIVSIGEELRDTVSVRFEDGVTLLGVHTLPPAGARYSSIRNQQLNELATYVAELDGPVIVAGDLNVSPWSPHFQRFIDSASLTDLRQGRGILNSWPSSRILTRIPIDHVLTTRDIEVGDLSVLSDSHGSDHYPMYCRWALRQTK